MKRKILFAILCIGILSTGAIFQADLVRSNTTSMFSDKELEKITGTGACTCYEIEHIDCRWENDLDCYTSSCPSEDDRYHDPYHYTTSSSGTRNDMKPSDGTVACYTPTNVIDDGDTPEMWCNTTLDYDEEEYTGQWYKCTGMPGDTCRECSWGTPSGSSSMVEDDRCVPI